MCKIVLDSFCGVGSTLLAAEKVGRICYGIEIESTVCRHGGQAMGTTNWPTSDSRLHSSVLLSGGGGPVADDSCGVGYRKPPRDSQFQKGRSGNPSGRPPKALGGVRSLTMSLACTRLVLRSAAHAFFNH